MFTVESVVDVGSLGVHVVEHYVGVAGMAGSEHDYFEVVAQIGQDVARMRTDVYSCLDYFSSGERDPTYNS